MTANPHERAELDALKAGVDLVALFEAHDISVKRLGKSCKASCPFHEDKTPSFSISPEKGLWKCFSCGKAGDALSFLQLHKGLSFPEALAALKQFAGAAPATQEPPPKWMGPHFEMLARVVELYHEQLGTQKEGLRYLQARGIVDLELLRELRVGYAPPRFLGPRSTPEDRLHLRELGLLDERGKELFSGCLVMPLRDKEGRITGLCGRACNEDAQVRHRVLAGPRKGMFWPQAARGAKRVLLVEGALDALACAQAGFRQVLALGGAQGLNDELIAHLVAERVAEVVLVLDGDSAGQAGAAAGLERLSGKGLRCRCVVLPDGEDPASFLSKHSRAQFAALLEPAAPAEPCLKKSYKKLSRGQGKLKVLVRLELEGKHAQDTVDLYSKRGRRESAQGLASELNLEAAQIEEWFFSILEELQREAEEPDSQDAFAAAEPDPMTPEEREEALAFLRSPNLVERLQQDLEMLGYMGDDDAKLLCYLISVSRKLEKPMSGILQSGSGAGKSYLAEFIAKLTPPDEVVLYSRLSQQALYHMPEDFLVHKLLMLEERAGGEVADYQIRTLQSSQFLNQAIVVKDPSTGKLSTRSNRVNGPIAYLETTTDLKLNPENTSRCFEIPLDESSEQTRRIHLRQRNLKSLEGLLKQQHQETIVARHHRAQRLLEPVPVVIPYVEHLTFPDRWLRTRRDHERFLCLIEVLAFLHQHQRPRKNYCGVDYIEANLDDYGWAYRLAQRVLPNSLDELSRWARELASTFHELSPGASLTRRELRERLRWPDRRTRDALEELVQLEHLEQLRSAQGNLFLYRLLDWKACGLERLGLLSPEELAQRWPT